MRKNKKDKTIIKDYVTKTHFDTEIQKYVTKTHFDSEVNRIDDRLIKIDQRIDKVIDHVNLRFESVEKKITDLTEKVDKFTDSIQKTLDWLVHRYGKLDEEHVVMSAGYPRMSEKIENHEQRISVLEKKTKYKTS